MPSYLKGYPEFNNQAVMSLLGNVFESDESGLTVEQINKDKYEEIVEENNKLREDNKKKRDELRKLIKQNKQLIISTNELKTQNDELKETIDEMYNMNLTSGVIIRRNENQLVKIKEAIEEVHEEVGGIKVKDRKLNKVQTITVLFTSPDKPKDKELRDHVPTGQTWIGTFNGESKYFIETGKHILYKSNSNRLDSFKSMLEHPNIAPLIREKTRYRDLLVRNEDIDALIQAVNSYLNRDETFDSVGGLDEALVEDINKKEIKLKRELMNQYNPLLINLNRYKRRVYVQIGDEFVLIEDIDNAELYPWYYRYGSNGSKIGELDYRILHVSRFTSDLETRINYE